MTASVYTQTGSLQNAAVSALACALALLLLRPMALHVFAWMKIHLAPVLLRRKELPPGSLGFLLIEETLHFISSLRQTGGAGGFVNERTARFRSPTFKTSLFLNSTVVVQGVEASRFLASAEGRRDLLNSWPASTLELLGKHVPSAVHGAQHRRQRQIMSACLGPAALQKVMGRADRMTRQHFEASWPDEAQLSIAGIVKVHVFRLACSLLAGAEDESLLSRMEAPFRAWIAGLLAVPLDVPGTTFNKARRARDVLRGQIDVLIQQRRRQLQQEQHSNGLLYEDVLSQMILARDENGNALTSEELRDVTLFLLFAGHDTSTAALTFALKFLEQNPSCHNRLVQEHEAIASKKKPGEALNWMDVTNMKYTWAFLQETLRLRPPSVGSMKEAQKELSYNGYIIPKGWKIAFPTFSTHENDDYFKDSSKFDPSRFELDRVQKEGPPPFSYVAFGIGPHSCKGGDFARMTMSLYIHHLIMGKIKWTSLELNEKYHCFPMPTFTKGYPVVVSREAKGRSL
ncbi:hypothetical protein GOP47_0002863 [Adiantum capillus-veneris]|uniref:Cytochrome P450 n=1 Tax=Adiantum capillus-veneris TaxID=13818 RepID=A0A9D4VBR0_ADICA|nr:hypothetical protein GOP47_0002863 [Adiantum capillus-veneris]